ncbi:MAG: DUF308 domain-containing protein, partial [Eubacterium sp.]|nr:DUF308 domain-containing protein [Eubacterium sp.]
MEGLVKKIKGIRNEMIGLSIVLMLAGIFMILFPNTSGNIICRGVGAVLCIWGVVRLVAYFRNNEILGSFGLVQGVALAGFGLYILIRPGIIEVFLTTVFAIFEMYKIETKSHAPSNTKTTPINSITAATVANGLNRTTIPKIIITAAQTASIHQPPASSFLKSNAYCNFKIPSTIMIIAKTV